MNSKNQYDVWHRTLAKSEAPSGDLVHPWHRTVGRLLPDLYSLRVLEIGCGRGDFSIWLSNRHPRAEIVAVDISNAAISIAKQRSDLQGAKISFRVEDAQSLSFGDGSFDFVISCECLEHVLHPQKMAAEIYRVLKPGGRFILTTPSYFNGVILAWLKSWVFGTPYNSGSGVQPHENFFLYWKVKRMLLQAGLTVEHMESNHFQWLLLPRTDPGKLVTRDFKSQFLRRVFRPFGLHFTFCGTRPLA